MSTLIDWFQANKLSLNLSKTNYILFRKKSKKSCNIDKLKLSFGDNEIKRVKCTKFLGLMLDENLTWEDHIKYLYGKISRNLYLINSIKRFVPKWSLRNLYFSYIQSHLQNGMLLWGPMVKKSSLKRVGTQQKKAVRILNNAKYNSNTATIFKRLKILKLEDLIDLNLAKVAYSFKKDEIPSQVSLLFNANSFNHNYNTRSGNNPMIEHH